MNNLDIYYIALIIRSIMRGKASKASTEEELLAIIEASGAFGIREGASQEEIEATKNYIQCIIKLQEKGRYSEGEQQWLITKAEKYRKAIINARKEYDNAGKIEASGAIEIRERASQEEIEATKNYIQCIIKLQEKGRYSEGEQQWLIAKVKKYRKAIIKARKEYDNAGKYISDTVAKANEVFENLKSPKYIADKKKRKSIFKSSYYGIDDPFYDSFRELYGDEGLLGYKKERLEVFEDIPYHLVIICGDEMPYHEVLKLASQRYKKVDTILTPIKTLASIAFLVVYFLKYFPIMVESAEGIPIINGIMLAISPTYLIIEMPRYPEISRSSHNCKIFSARLRIAKDLGIIDKDKTMAEIMKDDYKGE